MQAIIQLLIILFLGHIIFKVTCLHHPKLYTFVVKETPYTRLCNTKSILTVNGKYPGPTIYAHKGDTLCVKVINNSQHNITLHWHGVKQPRNPWSDGPEYITQCPIQPGTMFNQKIILSDEEGTLWWHAHSEWARATVHGAFIIYPKLGTYYPFPEPDYEVPIILGEWWISDVYDVYNEFVASGGTPNVSDAITINGQPGDLYHCSNSDTFKFNVNNGGIVLIRFINAAINTYLFISISEHPLTVVGTDGSYTKPLARDVILIAPGQTMDTLLYANQTSGRYYLAARAYSSGLNIEFVNTTTTAIIHYNDAHNSSSPPSLPALPDYNDTSASYSFISSLRSLDGDYHPTAVPQVITHRILTTVSINSIACPANRTCQGPNGTILRASMNNMSFEFPNIDILQAYYYNIKGVYLKRFPNYPPLVFNYTADYQDLRHETPNLTTRVKVLPYKASVEMTIQGTNLLAGLDHPIHLHGQSFYVVGMGFGNFDNNTDPKKFNLEDPPLQNIAIVLKNGWTTIRFVAKNPGVWYMHCHLDRHQTWGMMTAFIVLDGKGPNSRVLPPPPDMPPC